MDKNERFRRISKAVGRGRNKKDCYDKYKELKAESKAKLSVENIAMRSRLGGHAQQPSQSREKSLRGKDHDRVKDFSSTSFAIRSESGCGSHGSQTLPSYL
ncbi:unnamed protein product, partial [Discosporangium mesarthrocarpum]